MGEQRVSLWTDLSYLRLRRYCGFRDIGVDSVESGYVPDMVADIFVLLFWQHDFGIYDIFGFGKEISRILVGLQ